MNRQQRRQLARSRTWAQIKRRGHFPGDRAARRDFLRREAKRVAQLLKAAPAAVQP